MATRWSSFAMPAAQVFMSIVLAGVWIHSLHARAEPDSQERSGETRLAWQASPVTEARLVRMESTAPASARLRGDERVCPVSGKSGRSSLDLNEVMSRAHGEGATGVCPYASNPRAKTNCPYLEGGGAPDRRRGATWL